MRPLDKNNLHEEWIEEIKNRVNSIETELPADGFGAVMNSIRIPRMRQVTVILPLPTMFITV